MTSSSKKSDPVDENIRLNPQNIECFDIHMTPDNYFIPGLDKIIQEHHKQYAHRGHHSHSGHHAHHSTHGHHGHHTHSHKHHHHRTNDHTSQHSNEKSTTVV